MRAEIVMDVLVVEAAAAAAAAYSQEFAEYSDWASVVGVEAHLEAAVPLAAEEADYAPLRKGRRKSHFDRQRRGFGKQRRAWMRRMYLASNGGFPCLKIQVIPAKTNIK
jgi:hypothetical protein